MNSQFQKMLKMKASSKTSFNDQSMNEFWFYIFGLLDSVNDLLRCRMVNQQWKNLIDNIELGNGLHVINDEIDTRPFEFCFNGNYLFTNKPINSEMKLQSNSTPSSIQILGSSLMINKLTKLKRLSINYISIRDEEQLVAFEMTINCFKSLEQLQIKQLNIEIIDENGDSIIPKIYLPMIRIFTVLDFVGQPFCLDAPVERLGWFSTITKIELTEINKLKYLAADYYEKEMNQFDVQYLYLREENCSRPGVLIDYFQNLREIRFRLISRDNLDQLLYEKNKRRRNNLRIYVHDIEINDFCQITDLYGNQSIIQQLYTHQLLRNYKRLANLTNEITLFNYSLYIDQFKTVSFGFFSRFVNIQRVTISQNIDSQRNFVRFLRKCKVLNSLIIIGVIFDTTFYENLSILCPFLTELEIEVNQDLINDLTFVSKSKYLLNLSVNRNLIYSDYEYILYNLNYLKFLKFQIDYIIIELNLENFDIMISDRSFFLSNITHDKIIESKEIRFEKRIKQIFQFYTNYKKNSSR